MIICYFSAFINCAFKCGLNFNYECLCQLPLGILSELKSFMNDSQSSSSVQTRVKLTTQ